MTARMVASALARSVCRRAGDTRTATPPSTGTAEPGWWLWDRQLPQDGRRGWDQQPRQHNRYQERRRGFDRPDHPRDSTGVTDTLGGGGVGVGANDGLREARSACAAAAANAPGVA
jgi:hypothetical protein